MKKSIIALIVLAVTAGGCAQMKTLESVFSLTTASITNPVTKTRLDQTEQVMRVAFAALNVWKQSCIKGVIPPACKQQIANVQVYTRQIPPYLAQLRTFVKNNDQVNATVVFNQLMDVYNTVKSQAAANGVNVGS